MALVGAAADALSVQRAAGHRSSVLALVVGAAIVAAFLSMLAWMAQSPASLPAIGALWAGAMLVLGAGELVLAAGGAGVFAGRVPLSLVCGFVACAMVQLFGVFVLGLDAARTFVLLGVGIAIAMAIVFPRLPAAPGRDGLADCLVMGLIAGLILYALRDHVAVVGMLRTDGVLLNTDGVIHGAQLAQFGDPLGFARGSVLLSDVPLSLYHYGYYMPAAAIMRLLDMTPLATEAAILLPLGLFVGACGACALASSMAGILAGLIAIGLLFAFPDGAHLGVGNRFFGFQTVLMFEPGSGYAIGGAMAALACFQSARRSENRALWIVSAGLVAATFQLRAHVFILFAPVMVLLWLGEIPVLRRHRNALIAAGLLSALAGIIAVAVLPGLRAMVAGFSNAPMFFSVALDVLGPTIHPDFFHGVVETRGMGIALAVGLLVTIMAIFGVLLPIYLLMLLLARLRRGTTSLDAFPLLLLFVYSGLILLAPRAPFDDANTEFQHRPLVLAYAVFAVFTAVLAARTLRLDVRPVRLRGLLPATAIVASLSILPQATGLYAVELGPAALANFVRRPTSTDIVPVALHIRAHSVPGMTLAVGDIRAEDGFVDSCAELAAISGVPCFLSRPSIEAHVSPEAATLVAARLAILDRIDESTDLASARAAMKDAGITWYFVRGPGAPRFDPDLVGADMRTSFGALYRGS